MVSDCYERMLIYNMYNILSLKMAVRPLKRSQISRASSYNIVLFLCVCLQKHRLFQEFIVWISLYLSETVSNKKDQFKDEF